MEPTQGSVSGYLVGPDTQLVAPTPYWFLETANNSSSQSPDYYQFAAGITDFKRIGCAGLYRGHMGYKSATCSNTGSCQHAADTFIGSRLMGGYWRSRKLKGQRRHGGHSGQAPNTI
ncbi:Piso0_002009 [Millerozyma farinosa CBS 7064]|uniref:Piso0_002009 protein n=1 Tax=Pichia sorbitophila (strain ATCC MYA-4447 / BCRC 22081 / CBS 7064 / NBRC 10061 / NRRL Y-12695) TaxID=559304 RepID=G8YMA5_PICSO|nr:Piso0_002009 [Millerozyma farinosa CBS 7064]